MYEQPSRKATKYSYIKYMSFANTLNKIVFQWHASLGDISLHLRNHYVRQGLEYMNEKIELSKECLHTEDRKNDYREDNNET